MLIIMNAQKQNHRKNRPGKNSKHVYPPLPFPQTLEAHPRYKKKHRRQVKIQQGIALTFVPLFIFLISRIADSMWLLFLAFLMLSALIFMSLVISENANVWLKFSQTKLIKTGDGNGTTKINLKKITRLTSDQKGLTVYYIDAYETEETAHIPCVINHYDELKDYLAEVVQINNAR